MSDERRPVHEHDYGGAVIPCSQDHGPAPDERQAGLLTPDELAILPKMRLDLDTYAAFRADDVRYLLEIIDRQDRALRAALAVARVPTQPDEERDVFDPAAEGYRLMVPAQERLDVERLARALRAQSPWKDGDTFLDVWANEAVAVAAEYRALGVQPQDEGHVAPCPYADSAEDIPIGETGCTC